MRQRSTAAAIATAAMIMAGPATAVAATDSAEALQATGPRGAIVLTQAAGRLEVTQPQRPATRMALPDSTYLTAFAATKEGWFAAGIAQDENGSHLVLYTGGDPRVAAPRAAGAPRHGSTAHDPVLLATSAGQLAGLAWIENNGIRVAQRATSAWSEPREIANFAAGMTLALAGSVAEDGSWLLLWSAFDGQDDEIYWSRRDAQGTWSMPARIAKDNAVPDITPAVRAIPGGALAAWSRFDGKEYEVVVSRFDGTVWNDPRRIAGAALRPSFPAGAGTESAPLLLIRTARPKGWSLVAVQSGQDATQVSQATDDRGDRPLVIIADDRAQLRWPQPQP